MEKYLFFSGYLYFVSFVGLSSGSWVFVHANGKYGKESVSRDYCAIHIASISLTSTGKRGTANFRHENSIAHEGTFHAKSLLEFVILGDSSFGCRTDRFKGNLVTKLVVYDLICDDEVCFPCRNKIAIIEELTQHGVESVIFRKIIDSKLKFQNLQQNYKKDELNSFNESGVAELDLNVLEAVKRPKFAPKGSLFFKPDFQADLVSTFDDRPKLQLWILDHGKLVNKVVALPLLAVIAVSICCYTAAAAAQNAHHNFCHALAKSKKEGSRKRAVGASLHLDHEQRRQQQQQQQQQQQWYKSDIITSFFALAMIITMLLLIYFFIDWVIPVLLVIFALSAIFLVVLFNPLIEKIPFGTQEYKCLPRCCTKCCGECEIQLKEIFFLVFFFGLGVIWYIFRHYLLYIWPLHMLIGFGLIHAVVLSVSESMGVKARYQHVLLLSMLLFLYDIFMVFVTPLFTRDGESVMLTVAQGDSSGDIAPFVFLLPEFISSTETVCRGATYAAMLGFGDIVVPALLMFISRLFALCREGCPDLRSSNTDDADRRFFPLRASTIYGLAAGIAYALSLGMAMGMVFVFQSAQPALLYIVPLVNLAIIGVAASRGELKKLWAMDLSVESQAQPRTKNGEELGGGGGRGDDEERKEDNEIEKERKKLAADPADSDGEMEEKVRTRGSMGHESKEEEAAETWNEADQSGLPLMDGE